MIELFSVAGGKQFVLSVPVWLHAGVFLPGIPTDPTQSHSRWNQAGGEAGSPPCPRSVWRLVWVAVKLIVLALPPHFLVLFSQLFSLLLFALVLWGVHVQDFNPQRKINCLWFRVQALNSRGQILLESQRSDEPIGGHPPHREEPVLCSTHYLSFHSSCVTRGAPELAELCVSVMFSH